MTGFGAALMVSGLLAAGLPAQRQPVPLHEIEPYLVEEISFKSGHITLAGLFHAPNRRGPHPAVVILHGSGSEGYVNQYRFMAHWFASHGVATLFYFKRGTGESEGTYSETVDRFDPLAADALAAVAWLGAREDVNRRQIGFWAHSQGGWVASVAASRSAGIAFVINVSGPIGPPLQQITFQRARELHHNKGYSLAESDAALELIRAAYRYWHTGEDYEPAAAIYAKHSGAAWFKELKWPETLARVQDLGERSRAFLTKPSLSFDPRPFYETVAAPVLVVYGEDDWFIPVKESVAAFRAAARLNSRADMTLKIFENSGHAIGLQGEGGRIFYAPGYPEFLLEWLQARVDIQTERRP